jgi:hypothetical protein
MCHFRHTGAIAGIFSYFFLTKRPADSYDKHVLRNPELGACARSVQFDAVNSRLARQDKGAGESISRKPIHPAAAISSLQMTAGIASA